MLLDPCVVDRCCKAALQLLSREKGFDSTVRLFGHVVVLSVAVAVVGVGVSNLGGGGGGDDFV